MIRKLFYLFIVVCLLAAFNVYTGDKLSQIIVYERKGIRLNIPSMYISKYSLPWIDEVSGLDSSQNSIRVNFPIEGFEFERSGGHYLRGIITIISREEKEKIESIRKFEVSDRVNRRGFFSNAMYRQDEKTGFYKVYKTGKIKFMWSVLSQSPEVLKHSFTGKEWLAECSLSSTHKQEVCTSSFSYKNLLIEITGNSNYLLSYSKIISNIENTVSTWIIH